MIRDLQEADTPVSSCVAEVAVIGGGIAGLMLATRLEKHGISVAVVESGPRNGGCDDDPLNEVEYTGQTYRAADEGRVRGIGGTSVKWGGAMLPFLPCDMEAHTAGWTGEWPVKYAEVEEYYGAIERQFRLPSGTYQTESTCADAAGDFILRSAKWPSFKRRNIARLLKRDLETSSLQIWVNATATRFELDASGRVSKVHATAPSGNKLEVAASRVVIASGAIESTRLLLLLDSHQSNRIFKRDGQLGHYLHDHLSTAAAQIVPVDLKKLNTTFGLKFSRGGMRDLRIEPSPTLRRRNGLPAAFAHVSAASDGRCAFAALRDIYRNLQRSARPEPASVATAARDAPWLLRAAWWRFGRGRLLYPRAARFDLTLVIEQHPSSGNTITLADNSRDSFGVPRARIDWQAGPADEDNFERLQTELCRFWRGRFAKLGTLVPIPKKTWQKRLQSDASIYHPGGTTRMGTGPQDGVVDSQLRTFRVPNIHVVSTSVFPTGGTANPTFMLLAFAARAADHLRDAVRKGAFGCHALIQSWIGALVAF